MARTTTRLGLEAWDQEADLYNHEELYGNWDILDNAVLDRNGDTALGTIHFQLDDLDALAITTGLLSDTHSRVTLDGRGVSWGAGNDNPDVSIKRTGTGIASAEGRFVFSHSSLAPIGGGQGPTTPFIDNVHDGDTLFSIRGDGYMGWGEETQDTFLYRSAPQRIKIIDELEVGDLVASDSVSIGGNSITFSDGALGIDVPFVTSGYAAARNGHAGRIRLGDPSDPSNAIISFGPGPGGSIFLTSSPSLRLKTNNVFEAATLVSGNLTSTNGTIGGLTVNTLTANGSVVLNNNVSVSGSLVGQGGSFSGLDVRAGTITSSGASALTVSKNLNVNSPHSINAHTLNVSGYINSNWDLNAKHVYVNSGFVNLQSGSTLSVSGAAQFNGGITSSAQVTVNNDVWVGGSLYSSHLRGVDGVVRVHSQLQPLGGMQMGGQMIIGASLVATDNIRHSTNDPYAYIGFGPIRLVSTDAGARIVDLNHGYIMRGGVKTQGYNIETNGGSIYLSGGGIFGESDESLKHKFRALSDDKFFKAAKDLDVQSWSWKSGDKERHVGPTLQEFEDRFGYGVVEEGLNMMDMIGVLYKLSSIFARKIDIIEAKLSQETI